MKKLPSGGFSWSVKVDLDVTLDRRCFLRGATAGDSRKVESEGLCETDDIWQLVLQLLLVPLEICVLHAV